MTHDEHIVIIVYSTSHALKAEKVLQKAGITCKLIPVPRQISSDCGVCVRLRRVDQETALQALETSRVEFEGIYDS